MTSCETSPLDRALESVGNSDGDDCIPYAGVVHGGKSDIRNDCRVDFSVLLASLDEDPSLPSKVVRGDRIPDVTGGLSTPKTVSASTSNNLTE